MPASASPWLLKFVLRCTSAASSGPRQKPCPAEPPRILFKNQAGCPFWWHLCRWYASSKTLIQLGHFLFMSEDRVNSMTGIEVDLTNEFPQVVKVMHAGEGYYEAPASSEKESRRTMICGCQRTTFYLLLALIVVVLAAIAGGVGGALTIKR
jgi:hypothetical protein